METNQDQLRESMKLWCQSQKFIASELPFTHIHLNYWLKGHKDLNPEHLESVKKLHEDKKKALLNDE